MLVALLPQLEEIDTGVQVKPPGFQVIVLPFADDAREVITPPAVFDAEEREKIDAGKEQMKKVIDSMTAKNFDPLCIENPSLQKHWAAVQALALEEDWPERTEDLLSQNKDAWGRESVQANLKGFATAVYGEGGVCTSKGSKRKAGSPAKPSNKLPKIDADSKLTDQQLAALIQDDSISSYTVANLKGMCKLRKLPVSGTKTVIIDRLKEHVAHLL